MKTLPLNILLLSSCLTGCYTQLATRGHYARSQTVPAYGPEVSPADSLVEDSSLAASPAPADTLAPPVGAPTVIVQNYYDPQVHYRGYAHWEWDYPLVSFGYYSSHYGRYSRPYWWDDPWYRRDYHHHHHRPINYVPVRPIPSGPYKSEKRLFNPDPTYKPVRKGRRAAEPVSAPAEVAPAPVPKESSSGNSSSASSPGSEGSSEAKSPKQEDKPEKEHRPLQKGRRR